MASNKNVPALTEALAPEVFEFYISNQEEIDKNIKSYFAQAPKSEADLSDSEAAKEDQKFGKPISLNFASFIYRPPTLADNQLLQIAEKFNRNRPSELDEFGLEEKKTSSKRTLKKPAFNSSSMKSLFTELKLALSSRGDNISGQEYGLASGLKVPHLITEPSVELTETRGQLNPPASCTFRTTFHKNMMEAARGWRITCKSQAGLKKKASLDAIQLTLPKKDSPVSPDSFRPSDKMFEARKTQSFLNITPGNYVSKLKPARPERSVGHTQESKVKSSRLDSEFSATHFIEDSFKLHATQGMLSPSGASQVGKFPAVHVKTHTSEESELYPRSGTTKTSSHTRLMVGGKTFSHLRQSINSYVGEKVPDIRPEVERVY